MNWIKIIKWIAVCALLAYAVTLTTLYTSEVKHNKQTSIIVKQHGEMIERLGALEGVHCEISFVINNKAVFGSIKNGDMTQVAEATLHYLRSELVNDSFDKREKSFKKFLAEPAISKIAQEAKALNSAQK